MRYDLSGNLNRLMRERAISQAALSRATGVSQPTINRILCEVTLHPRHDSLVSLANFFGVTPDSIYGSPSKKNRDNSETYLNELSEKIRCLSAAGRSDLFVKIAENPKKFRLDDHRSLCRSYMI